MASEFATENGHKIARLLRYYDGPPYNIPEIVDAELQEVREVLMLLRRLPDSDIPCWCVMKWRGDHDGPCQRTRALMERLEL